MGDAPYQFSTLCLSDLSTRSTEETGDKLIVRPGVCSWNPEHLTSFEAIRPFNLLRELDDAPDGFASTVLPKSYQLGPEELTGYRLLALAYKCSNRWYSASLGMLSPVLQGASEQPFVLAVTAHHAFAADAQHVRFTATVELGQNVTHRNPRSAKLATQYNVLGVSDSLSELSPPFKKRAKLEEAEDERTAMEKPDLLFLKIANPLYQGKAWPYLDVYASGDPSWWFVPCCTTPTNDDGIDVLVGGYPGMSGGPISLRRYPQLIVGVHMARNPSCVTPGSEKSSALCPCQNEEGLLTKELQELCVDLEHKYSKKVAMFPDLAPEGIAGTL